MAKNTIKDGSGLDKLRQMIKYQGGNPDVIDDYSLFGYAESELELTYEDEKTMYVESIDALLIGQTSVLLGAGRATKEDVIDHHVGIVINKKIGDKVQKGDVIATIYSNGTNEEQALENVLDAFVLSEEKVEKPKVIYETIR